MINNTCIFPPNIILPKNSDFESWSVIACDQFTSDKEYWRKLENFVGNKPSTLRLTFPEIYLKDNPERRIENINLTMKKYFKEGVFKKLDKGFVFVERKTPFSDKIRKGIVLAIDLDEYSFVLGEKPLIRATEATILERIPPRVKIREGADFEFPHIMLLYNDKENKVVKNIEKVKNSLKKLYDFDLNMNGGHITGHFIDDYESVITDFNSLVKDNLMFLVGDGNHSLATAKTCWENIKKTLSHAETENHPARYALCEAVNIYDEALKFEPIYRYVTNVDVEKFYKSMPKKLGDIDCGAYINGIKREFFAGNDIASTIRQIDDYIKNYIDKFGGEVDYVHGEDEIATFTTENKNSIGIILPKTNKDTFFEQIISHGNLPRKTFSMGEAQEKRYYIEGKEIVKR